MNCEINVQNLFGFNHNFICHAEYFLSLMNVHLQVEKNVFVVFYSGERAKTKILKICEAFGANRYSFTEDISKQVQMITEVWAMLLLELFVVI